MHFKKLLLDFVTEPNPMYAMLKWLIEELMKIEVECKVGVAKHKHYQQRKTCFSGYRIRRFDSQLGTIYLSVPKLRNGGYIPFFLIDSKRTEDAMIKLIQEAFVKNVSIRKVKHLTSELGIKMVSSNQLSHIKNGLDRTVEDFRQRNLESFYLIIWVDEMYECVRMNGHLVKMGVLIISGINKSGIRDILSVRPIYRESKETYKACFNRLKERGLTDVSLVVSDNYLGIQNAIKECFPNAFWQRCRAHLVRSILLTVNPRDIECISYKLNNIWNQKTRHAARDAARSFINEFEEIYPQAVNILKEGLEDSLNFYGIIGIKTLSNSLMNT